VKNAELQGNRFGCRMRLAGRPSTRQIYFIDEQSAEKIIENASMVV